MYVYMLPVGNVVVMKTIRQVSKSFIQIGLPGVAEPTRQEKRRFSVPILMTWCHQIDITKSKLNTELYFFCCTGRQKCTKLHRFAPIFSQFFRGDTPGPHNWGEGSTTLTRPLPSARVHRPTFSELPRHIPLGAYRPPAFRRHSSGQTNKHR